MKYLFLTLSMLSLNCAAIDYSNIYFKVGVGHKIQEPDAMTLDKGEPTERTIPATFGDKTTARFELGYEYNRRITFGVSHHSQWFEGWPVNNNNEYYKTELFVDIKFKPFN